MPAEGADVDQLVHGVDKAASYPYVASYLSTKYGFKADALVHFGTHGSLEFIPGKSLALSEYDWTDALVGEMSHFYIYTINNIGEGIIAKRRSYATLVSHLTAPFMQGGLYADFIKIKNHLDKVRSLYEGGVKETHRNHLVALCKQQNIFAAIGLDENAPLVKVELDKIHNYVVEIEGAKVTDGLYTLGMPYSKENLDETTRLMSLDNIRYALAELDVAQGNIASDQLDNLAFITERYTASADRLIMQALQNTPPEELLASVVDKVDLHKLIAHRKVQAQKSQGLARMMQAMKARSLTQCQVQTFLTKEGDIILGTEEGKEELTKMPSAMQRMAQAKSSGLDDSMSKDHGFVQVIVGLEHALKSVTEIRKNLEVSTSAEHQALLNALNGGYLPAGSAGDPG